MIHLDKENLKEIIGKGKYLVDFYADWCGPCKMLGPVLEEIDGLINVVKVNVDEHNELANEYKVMSIPTILFVKDGEVVSRKVGFQTKEEIISIINSL